MRELELELKILSWMLDIGKHGGKAGTEGGGVSWRWSWYFRWSMKTWSGVWKPRWSMRIVFKGGEFGGGVWKWRRKTGVWELCWKEFGGGRRPEHWSPLSYNSTRPAIATKAEQKYLISALFGWYCIHLCYRSNIVICSVQEPCYLLARALVTPKLQFTKTFKWNCNQISARLLLLKPGESYYGLRNGPETCSSNQFSADKMKLVCLRLKPWLSVIGR